MYIVTEKSVIVQKSQFGFRVGVKSYSIEIQWFFYSDLVTVCVSIGRSEAVIASMGKSLYKECKKKSCV